MIHRTRGIVFRTIKFSETSVVSKIYTEKFGLQSYIVNSVRSSKAKTKAAVLQSMSMLDLEVYHHENRNLHRIRELAPFYHYRSLLFDPLKSSLGLFIIDVLHRCIREEESNAKMFDSITGIFRELDEQEKVPVNFLLTFLLQLAEQLGFSPHGRFTEATPQFSLQDGSFVASGGDHVPVIEEQMARCLSALLDNERAQVLSSDRRKLLEVLLEYYRLHVPNFTRPKSLKVLEEVFRT